MKKILQKPVFWIVNFVALFFLILVLLYIEGSSILIEQQTNIVMTEKELMVDQLEHKISSVNSIIKDVSSYILTQENQDDLRPFLISLESNCEFVTQLYFGTPDNVLTISSDFVPDPDFDLTQRPWYIDAVIAGDIVYTDAYIDAAEDRIVVTGTYPVYKEGVLLGVVGADIEIREITSFVNSIESDYQGYGFIIDNSGRVISHKDLDPESIEFKQAEYYGIPSEQLIGNEGITNTVNINGISGKIIYQIIPGTNYTFGMFVSNNVLNQSSKIFSYISFVVLAIFILIVAVIFMMFQYYIYRPISSLIDDIYTIDPINKPEHRLSKGKDNQFNKARDVINELIDDTVKSNKQAKERLEEISLRNQKINMLLESSPDILFTLDINYRYLDAYGKGLESLHLKEEDIIGKTFCEVFDIPDIYGREKIYKSVLKGNKEISTWKFVDDNGNTLYFETVLAPFYNIDNEIIGIVDVTRDITEQQIRYDELIEISTHDHLTGLYNRRYNYQKLDELDKLKDYPIGLINIDINGLKIINDAYGHATGDLALKKTAEILLKNTRRKDIVSRISGDEFTIIIPKATEEYILKLKSKLQKAFSVTKIKNINISVAIGYYIKKDDSIDLDDLRKLAENDMFRHKITEHKSVKNRAISAILKTLTDKYESEKNHSEGVCKYSYELGKAIGLSEDDLVELKTAATFHDIGKISIPDEILNKPDKLTKEEYEIVKSHTEIGYEILRAADEYSDLAIYVSHHHERWDGLGYPYGIKGEKIPEFSRIICIADAYEAMTSDRPYRKRMSKEYAVSEIIKNAGTQFDPRLAKVFVEKVLKAKWTK